MPVRQPAPVHFRHWGPAMRSEVRASLVSMFCPVRMPRMSLFASLRELEFDPAAYRAGQLPGLDAGCVRLLPAGVRAGRDRRPSSTCTRPRSASRIMLTLDGTADRRAAVRPSGRPLRPTPGADGRRAAVLGAGAGLRICAIADGAAGTALPFGIAMGGEWGIGASLAMETIPAKARGAGLRPAAERLPLRLLSRRAGLLGGLQRAGAGLARDVRRRRVAGPAGALPARQGAGVADLAGRSCASAVRPRRLGVDARPLEAAALHDAADGRVQHVQPWLAGHVPHLPEVADCTSSRAR